MNYLYSAAEAATLNEQQLGGKAANLLWLTAHDYPVPNWWVIPASAMDEMLSCDAKAAQLMAQLSPQMPADQIETLAGENQRAPRPPYAAGTADAGARCP
ncbi:UNVERIFIED_ORG: phosphoenolpyruvate synthase/pyruvate phosphate dikinase [Atlantibacter sp. SORGH_AS 304]|nr:phosphoenolpyruvate synthase/pyruvate phosphate dikinase [Atlantibacter sp. SORGH_AS_0304]